MTTAPAATRIARPVRWMMSRDGTLIERATRGGAWLILGEGFNRLAGFLKIVILAHLLHPSDFGVFGVAMVLAGWLAYFSQTGFDSALIQRRGDIRPYLDSAWTVQIIRCVLQAGLLFVLAPIGAQFFASPHAVPIIRAVGLEILFYAPANPAVIYFRKELHFRNDVYLRASGTAAGLVFAIVFAAMYRSAWALVGSLILARAVETWMSYRIQPYRPHLRLDWDRVREMTRFGRWVYGSNVFAFFDLYTDSVIVGRVLGALSLGLYQMSSQMVVAPLALLGMQTHTILFSTLSKIDRAAERRRAFHSALLLVTFIVLPMSLAVCMFAGSLVPLVLGPKWLAIIPCVQLLAWAGAAKSMSGVMIPVFLSTGNPHLQFRSSVLKFVLLAAAIVPLTLRFGIVGAAVSSSVSAVAALTYQWRMASRLLATGPRDLASSLGPSLQACLVIALAWLTSRHLGLIPELIAGGCALLFYAALARRVLPPLLRGWALPHGDHESHISTGRQETEAPTTLLTQSSIAANYRKGDVPAFLKTTRFPAGWREDLERSWNPARELWRWRDFVWGWRLFRDSRSCRAVVTGYEHCAVFLALLQLVFRRKRAPHVMIYTHWNFPRGGLVRRLRACEYHVLCWAVDRFVVQSFRQRELYRTRWRIPEEKLAYLPYYATANADRPISRGDYIFSGGDYTRDYRLLINVVRDLPYRVIIAARLRVYFEGLEIPPNVEIVTVSHEEFQRLIAGSRVVVVPLESGLLHSGGQQTYLNAMTMGKPVIVADDCGADEYIENGVDGIVVAPGDEAALRDAILRVYTDPSYAELMGKRAARRAENFSHARYCDRLLEIVEGLQRS